MTRLVCKDCNGGIKMLSKEDTASHDATRILMVELKSPVKKTRLLMARLKYTDCNGETEMSFQKDTAFHDVAHTLRF